MSGYIGNIPVPQATQIRDTFVATSGQTVFVTGGYTQNYVDVYLNGVKLVDGDDFTATNGFDVVLAVGATAGDQVEVIAFTAFNVTNVSYNDLLDVPTFATVATTGSYTDLSNVPANIVVDASYVHTDNNYTTTEKSKLAGIEAGATADQTAAEILTAIKTVDGAGSGLDADTLDGNHASAFALVSHTHDYVPERNRSDWGDGTVINNVIGQLAWKNYGNNHTIFDASAGTSPSGTAINNTNPNVYWTGSYPTLMGWNGSNTYGVRVDTARYAESAAGAFATGVYSGGRSQNTTYQNTSGKNMFVEIHCESGDAKYLQLSSDGVNFWNYAITWAYNTLGEMSAVIPHGWYYRLYMTGGQSIASWTEVR